MTPVARRRRRPHGWRGILAWLRERPFRLPLLYCAGAGSILILWVAWTVWSASGDLREVERSASLLRQEIERGDADGAARALQRYQTAAGDARDRTDGPTWWVLQQLPGLGDDAEAVATAAEVLEDLGNEGLPPLVDATEVVAARSFNPTDHRFPLDTIRSIREPARASKRAFDGAATALGAVDESGLAGPVATRFTELRTIVLDARVTLGSAYRAAELMPTLLGAGGPRDHLLVFQNNAELRSLGGLAGSISRVRAVNGEIRIVEQEGTSQYGALERPIIRLTRGEEAVFGDTLGQWFMNASMSPDVPRAASLARAWWEREVRGEIDGVFFVDPVAVSYLLSATGPVDVPGYGPVSSTDVVAKVENQIYLTTADRTAQENYQNAVADAVFDAFAVGRGDPIEILENLARGVREGRIRMHSFRAEEQEQITGTEIAGEIILSDDAHVGVYLNDALESKMTYYLEHSVSAVARSCSGYSQEIAGSIEMTNSAPDDGSVPPSVSGIFPGKRFFGEVEPGQQRLAVYVMAPRGGELDELTLDGRSFKPVVTATYDGRAVAQVVTILKPGETQQVDFEITTGPGQTGPIELDVTPGAFPGTSAATLRSAC